MQSIIKLSGMFFLVFFFVFDISAQSAIRLTIPIVSTTCFNGVDDDGDGFVDYPDDIDCTSQSDPSEHHLTATCIVSSTAIALGQSATWTVTPAGGGAPYAYSWSGSEIVGNTATINITYTSEWTKTATVTVTSGFDALVLICPNSVTVGFSNVPNNTPPSSTGWAVYGISNPWIVIMPTPYPEGPTETLPFPENDIPPQLNSAPEKDSPVYPGSDHRNTPQSFPSSPLAPEVTTWQPYTLPMEKLLDTGKSDTEKTFELSQRNRHMSNDYCIIFLFYAWVSIIFLYFFFRRIIFPFFSRKRWWK